MIKKIEIKKFKKVKETSLLLQRMNVLVGSNNSGKSSIIQAIQFAVASAQSVEFSGTQWKRESLNTSLAPEEFLYTPIKDIRLLYHGGVLRATQKRVTERGGIQITFFGTDETECTVSIFKGKIKNLSVSVKGHLLGRSISSTENPFSIYVPGLAGIPNDERYITPIIIRKSAAKGDANNVLRNILFQLRQCKPDWETFIEELGSVFDNSNIDIHVEFDNRKDEFIRVSVVIDGLHLALDSLGTGMLQAIQILSYINYFKPKLLLLDEPDSHVHPTNQKKLVLKLWEIANSKDMNIILTTHSKHILSAVYNKASVIWIKDGAAITDGMEYDILLDIGALESEHLFANKLVRLFVLTEDKVEDVQHTKSYLKILLEANGFSENEILLFSYEGCYNTHTIFALQTFIRKQIPGVEIIVHRDRDFYEENDKEISILRQRLATSGIPLLLTPGYDIESYFVNTAHIKALYPELPNEVITLIINESVSEVRDKSINKIRSFLINKRREHYEKHGHIDINQAEKDAEKLFDSNPHRFAYSKTVRGLVTQKISQNVGGNINLAKASGELIDPLLQTVLQNIELKKENEMAAEEAVTEIEMPA